MTRNFLPARTTRLLEIAAIGSVIILYALLKTISLNIVTGDGGVWYYAGYLWSQGIVPYRDFFMSHGPVHILVPAIAILLFGVSLPLLNAIPSIFAGVSGWLVYRIVRHEWGAAAGFLAAVLFLFGPNQLVQSSHLTGVNITTMFLLLGVERFLRGRTLQSGLAFGTGMMAGAYILPGFAVICLIALMENWRKLRPLLKGFALVVVPAHLLFLALAGLTFIEQVYFYHLQKVAGSPYFTDVPSVVFSVMKQEQILLLLAALGLHIFLLSQSRIGKRWQALRSWPLAGIALLITGDYLLFFASLNRVFIHYFLLLFPFAAIAGSYGLVSLLNVRLPFPWRWSRQTYRTLAMLIVAFVALKVPFAGVTNFGRISWTNHFKGAHDLAIYLNSVLADDETIFGDFGVVPTVALLANRRIAANEAESSLMRFEGNRAAFDAVIRRIEADNVAAVLIRPSVDLHVYPPFREYLEKNYVLDKRFVGAAAYEKGNVTVWRKIKKKQ